MKPDCLRRTTRPESKRRWRLIRVFNAEEDEALKRGRPGSVRMTIRKCLRREQRRARLAQLATILSDIDRKEKMEATFEESPVHRHPARAMAPANTTQYLMSNVYEDMKMNQTAPVTHETSAQLYDDCLSPGGVYTALDSDHYESCLAFQQRDFEEEFGLCS